MTAATSVSPAAPRAERPPASALAAFALLERIRFGSLDVVLPDGTVRRFGQEGSGPRAAVTLANWRPPAAALRSGDVGFGDAFVDGDWTSPDLVALLSLFIANRDAIEAAVYGSWWGSLAGRLRDLLRRNTKRGARANILAHYDLGNAFYALWLDPTMLYSSALFEGDPARTLEAAQQAKVRRALDAVRLGPGERLLEIGCGWGGLATAAAQERGARVVGLTLSDAQLAAGNERLAAAGVPAGQVSLRLQDYRDLGRGERFDAVCSIEMVEAVGRAWWPAYFGAVSRALKPGGRACIQSITIRDDLFDRYLQSTDWIRQSIFPGGCLPSPAQFRVEAEQAGLRVVEQFAFGADYVLTLRRWRERFLQQESAVRAQGFDARFVRAWELYLAYCEAAFASGNTDVVQFTLEKPES